MKRILSLVATIAFSIVAFSQSAADSRGISFQGIARDNTGLVYASKAVSVVFTIKTGTAIVYQETHASLPTDMTGVFSAVIGSGVAASGFKYTAFNVVDFSFQYTVAVTISVAGATPVLIGEYPLQSVPYAKYAANGVPAGTIVAYGSAIIPAGWLLCDGRAFDGNLAQYEALYAALGQGWGSGSGCASCTKPFNIPDLRGAFLRGVDAGRGWDDDRATRRSFYGGNTGDKVGTYEGDAMISHTHTNTVTTNGSHVHGWIHGVEHDDSGSGGSYSEFTTVGGSFAGTDVMNYAGDHSHTVTINNTGVAETRPENMSVYYIIKL